MYKVLVVDDEPLMRMFLSKKIPEFVDQYEVCCAAKDGQEAIDYLQDHHGEVDVVITDIKMPEVDGLTLAKHVSVRYPDIIIIIISGYSDFEYARKAIQYNVTDYLLKPLQDKSLTEVLQAVALRLSGGTLESKFITAPKSIPGDSLRHELVHAILDGDAERVYKTYEALGDSGLHIMGAAGCIVRCRLLYMVPWQNNTQLMESAFYTLNILASEVCSTMGFICLYGKNGDSYMLVDGRTPSELESKVTLLYQKMCCDSKSPGAIDFYCGKTVSDIMRLSQSMESLSELWPLSIVSASGVLFYPSAQPVLDDKNEIARECSQILEDIDTGSREELVLDIRHFCQNHLQLNVRCLWRAGAHLIEEAASQTRDIPSDGIESAYHVLSNACLSQGQEAADSDIYADALYRALSSFVTCSPEAAEHELPVIRKAREFILENFQTNISLQDVAAHCGVSASYLSDLFHKQLGISYSKYIVKLRMEQAAKFLRNYPDMKVYEVAEKTGFTSAKHFISVFKKHYGISPSQFQRNAKGA